MQDHLPVLDFWFRELTPNQWFADGGPKLDAEVRRRFGALAKQAAAGELDDWAATPRGRLALILLLDQFPRHIYREHPQAYATDKKAQGLVTQGIEAGQDMTLSFAERQFFYMPLMHAEDVTLQRLSVAQFEALRDEAEMILDFARRHADIVERFGRFPHRNEVLDRSASAEEEAFAAQPENRF